MSNPIQTKAFHDQPAAPGRSSATFNMDSPFTAGSTVVVTLSCGDTTPSPSSVTLHSDADVLVQRSFSNHPNISGSCAIYDITACTGGNTDIKVTFTGNWTSNYIKVYELPAGGHDGTAPTPTSGNSTAAVGPTVTPAGTGDVFIQAGCFNSPAALDALSPAWTGTMSTPGYFGSAYLVASDHNAHAASWTLSSNHWQVVGAAYLSAPVTGAGAGTATGAVRSSGRTMSVNAGWFTSSVPVDVVRAAGVGVARSPVTSVTGTSIARDANGAVRAFAVGHADPLVPSDPRGNSSDLLICAPPGSGVPGAGVVPSSHFVWQQYSDLGPVCMRYIGPSGVVVPPPNVWVRGSFVSLVSDTGGPVLFQPSNWVFDSRRAADQSGGIYVSSRGSGAGFACVVSDFSMTIAPTDCSFYTSTNETDKNAVTFGVGNSRWLRCETWGGQILPDPTSGQTFEDCWHHHPQMIGTPSAHMNSYYFRDGCAGATILHCRVDQFDGVDLGTSGDRGVTSTAFFQGSGSGNRLIGSYFRVGGPNLAGTQGQQVAPIYNQTDTGLILQDLVLESYAVGTKYLGVGTGKLAALGNGSLDTTQSFNNRRADGSRVTADNNGQAGFPVVGGVTVLP